METIQMNLFDYFLDVDQFTIKEATDAVKNVRKMNVNDESIRARIYEGVDKGIFKKIDRGVYKVESQIDNIKTTCLLINGDGRDLSMIEDNSVDGIITDHPYSISKALTGGNRKFATYEMFKYESNDFAEKQRILKPGGFLVEFLPEESELNYEYLFMIKQYAKDNGLNYFAKVPWIKGNFVANTGRKSKNIEDVMIFSKGEPRTLKLDAKKNIAEAKAHGFDVKGLTSWQVKDLLEDNFLDVHYMKGTSGMLPTAFNYQPKNNKEKIMEAEKPVELLEEIIGYISKPYETLVDQFGGSGNFAIACNNTKRNAVVIEKNKQMFNKMKSNITKNIANCTEYYIEDDLMIDMNTVYTNDCFDAVNYEPQNDNLEEIAIHEIADTSLVNCANGEEIIKELDSMRDVDRKNIINSYVNAYPQILSENHDYILKNDLAVYIMSDITVLQDNLEIKSNLEDEKDLAEGLEL